jgi:uncharacterized membrane protein
MNSIDEKNRVLANRLHTTNQVLLLSLLFSYCVTTLALVPPSTATPWVPLVVQTVPLLIFAPAIYRGRSVAQIWLCFLLLTYFCFEIMNAFRIPALSGYLALARGVLIGALFVSCSYYVRYRSRADKANT